MQGETSHRLRKIRQDMLANNVGWGDMEWLCGIAAKAEGLVEVLHDIRRVVNKLEESEGELSPRAERAIILLEEFLTEV